MLMDETKIRNIVKQEIARQNNMSQYVLGSSQRHTHNGLDSLQVRQDSIVPSVSVSGSIRMRSEAIYTLYINGLLTPRNIFCTGNAQVIGGAAERYMFVGTAQLGPSFFLQPKTSRSVVVGGPQYPFTDPNNPEYGSNIPMQSCSYWGSETATSGRHTLVGNFHIIDIQYPEGTSHARATVIDFNKNAITIAVETLDDGWEINANFVIT